MATFEQLISEEEPAKKQIAGSSAASRFDELTSEDSQVPKKSSNKPSGSRFDELTSGGSQETVKTEERGILRTAATKAFDATVDFYKGLETQIEQDRDVPLGDVFKEALIGANPLGSLFIKDPKTSSLKNSKAALGGLIRGTTLGWIDPTPEEEAQGPEKVFGEIGELAGFALPISAGQKGLQALKILKSPQALQMARAAGAKVAGNSLFRTVVGETLLGAGIGATKNLEEDESRAGAIVTDAVLFGGTTLGIKGAVIPAAKGVGQLFSKSKNLMRSMGLLKRDVSVIKTISNETLNGSAETHLTHGESQNFLQTWENPEVQARVMGDLGPKELMKVRKISSLVEKKTTKIAEMEKAIYDDSASVSSKLDDINTEMGRLKLLSEEEGGLKFASRRIDSLSGEQPKMNILKNKIESQRKKLLIAKDELKALTDGEDYKRAQDLFKLGINEMDAVSARGVVIDPLIAKEVKGTANLARGKEGTAAAILAEQRAGRGTALDPRRIAEINDRGDPNGVISRIMIRPAERATVDFKLESDAIRGQFNQLITESGMERPGLILRAMNTGSVKEKIERSERLFDFAEGKITAPEEVAKITDPEKKLAGFVKNSYSSLLERINNVRRSLNIDPIRERQDYVTHLKELNFLQRLGRDLSSENADVLSNAFISPKSPFFRFAKERIGGEYEKDLIGAFDAYIEPALRQIHFSKVGAQAKAYAAIMPDPFSRRFWKEWADETLLGKRGDELLGKTVAALSDKLVPLTSKGAILGNVSTLLLQPSTALLTTALTSTGSSLKGLVSALSREGKQFALKNSKELAMREVELDLPEKIITSSVEKGVGWLNSELDRFMVRHSFLSAYNHGTKKGLSHEASVRFADSIAGKTQATYNRIFSPKVFRDKSLKPFVQFQTFMFNLWNTTVTDVVSTAQREGKAPAIKKAGRIVAAMVGTNILYEASGLPPPFEFSSGVVRDEKGNLKFDPSQVGFGFVPIIGSTAKFGGSPVVKTAWALGQMAFNDNPQAKDKAMRDIRGTAPLFVPFGNQLRKTSEGLIALEQGYTTIGKKKIPIKGIPESVRAILLGPRQTVAARKEFERRRNRND